MARTDKHFRLRISEGLHLQVELAARASGRSMNAEIIQLIEAGLAPAAEPTYTAAQVAELLAALEARRIPGEPLAVPMPVGELISDLNAYLAGNGTRISLASAPEACQPAPPSQAR